MALQKTISTSFGVNGDYVKIHKFTADKDNVQIDVQMFVDQAARNAGNSPIKYWQFSTALPTGTSNDIMVDLYDHLKTLPEFSGAVDV